MRPPLVSALRGRLYGGYRRYGRPATVLRMPSAEEIRAQAFREGEENRMKPRYEYIPDGDRRDAQLGWLLPALLLLLVGCMVALALIGTQSQ